MVFELKKGLVFTGKYFTGRVEVLDLDDSKEEGLHVHLTNENGYTWEENWNQEHTIVGFERGDYFIRVCERCDGTGKIRANYTNKDGKYVFHKDVCPECNGDLIDRMLDFGKTDEDEEDTTIGGLTKKMLEDKRNEIIELENTYKDIYDINSSDRPKPLKRGYYDSIRTEPKIGRNDPCPCGSGKKYKNCCLS